MTNEHYLEVAKECGAILRVDNRYAYKHLSISVEQLSAYTARICAEKDAEICRLQAAWDSAYRQAMENGQKLSTANAAIAMQAEALKTIHDEYCVAGYFSGAGAIKELISASSETVEAFMAEHDAKVLEEALNIVYSADDAGDAYSTLSRKISELRALEESK